MQGQGDEVLRVSIVGGDMVHPESLMTNAAPHVWVRSIHVHEHAKEK